MSNFLDEMSLASGARAKAAQMPADLPDVAAYPVKTNGFDLIAEIKERSPAEGDLSDRQLPRAERARAYAQAGAAAISVLTEPDRFAGDVAHLGEVVDAVSEFGTPVMRKDFLVAPVQVREAKAAGASGVLLIAAMLDDDELPAMLDCALELDLFVLLESFDTVDLERTAHLLQKSRYREQASRNKLLVGVNSRNLRTLAVDPLRLQRFASALPAGVVGVAESGLHTPGDAAEVAEFGYGMALVGTALMRSEDPQALIREMLAAGRARVAA